MSENIEELNQDLTEDKKDCGCNNPNCDCTNNCTCTEEKTKGCDCKGSDCKCSEGEECGCDEECNCGDKCSCGDDCKCDGLEKDCGCGDTNCTCGDNCTCTEENNCGCDCWKDKEQEQTTCDCGDNDCHCKRTDEVEQAKPEYFELLLKLQAEFDNYRKRTEQDTSKAYKNGFMDAVTDFLPALDSFKMATEYITDKNTLMGIEYIEKGILATLEKMGVKVIDATGKFDPNFHQAIDTDSTADVEEGYIVKECYKGFIMGDKVIRYSQVIVKK